MIPRTHVGPATETSGPTLSFGEGGHAFIRNAFDGMPALVAIHEGPDHVLVYSNNRHDQIFASRQHIGLPLRDAMPELYDQGVLTAYDRVLKTGELVEQPECRVMIASTSAGRKETKWLHQSLQPWRNDAGEITGVISFAYDITAQVEARQKVEQRQVELEFALEAGRAVGTWDWDVAEDTVSVDRRFGRLFGIPEDEIGQGLPLQRFVAAIHEDDRDRVGKAIAEAVASGLDYAQDYRVRDLDGRIAWVTARGRCFYGPDGAPSRFPGVVADITSQVEAREQIEASKTALQESEDRRQRAMTVGRVGTFEYYPVEQRVVWDAMTREIFGMSPQGALHLAEISDLIHPDDRPRWKADLAGAVDPSGSGYHSAEIRIRRSSDGAWRWIEAEGQASFKNGRACLVVGTVRDVTERREFEERLSLLNRELHHRVKNLFSMIKGLVSSSARKETELPVFAVKLRQRIDALAAAHLVSMAEEDEKTNSLDELVRTILSPHDLAEETVTLEGPLMRLPAHAVTPLGLILHELATNAAKHGVWSRGQGRLFVHWRNEGLPDERRLVLFWNETGFEAVEPLPHAKPGFGAQLIDASVRQFSGSIARHWDEHGLTVRIELPLGGG